jgi:hypothetical protein
MLRNRRISVIPPQLALAWFIDENINDFELIMISGHWRNNMRVIFSWGIYPNRR